jgi:hypothetical protein
MCVQPADTGAKASLAAIAIGADERETEDRHHWWRNRRADDRRRPRPQGLAAEVYEQAPELKEVGAGVGLWANALSALEPIGLADAVLQLGERIARQHVKRPDGIWLMCYPGAATGGPGRSGLGDEPGQLRALLR